MPGPTLRSLRFLRRWRLGGSGVHEGEARVEAGESMIPTTVLRPESPARNLPAWIVLHGVTRPGRTHGELLRFGRALAHSGALVLVPEIREWRELRLAPERTVPVIRACADHLARTAGDAPSPPVVVGFSFGAPQALRAAADPALEGRLGGVVGFGGYFDVERTFLFQLSGIHEWRGRRERLRPDPYGRWIIGANYLTGVPRYADHEDVARALHRLAATAGDEGVSADDPRMESLQRRLRSGLSPRHRDLFDLFVPPEGGLPSDDDVEVLAADVAAAARAAAPGLVVGPHLSGIGVPVELIHGRHDRLIPYTETLRLRRAFPDEARVKATVTGLFSHSGESGRRSRIDALREGWAFVATLRRVFALG